MEDDRIQCKDCAAREQARCGGKGGFWYGFEIPINVRKMPLRCVGFVPLKGDADQRTGVQRWVNHDEKRDDPHQDRARPQRTRALAGAGGAGQAGTDGGLFDDR